LEQCGPTALSDTELLATAIQGAGLAPNAAFLAAARLLHEAGSLARLAGWSLSDLTRLAGIRRTAALRLVAAIEIGRRVLQPAAVAEPLVNRADLVAQYLSPSAAGLDVEKFWVLCLNRKNRLLKLVEITSGTATAALAHPREVFRAAIREAAAAIICAHNHPSGDPGPSAPDVQCTRQLREAARAVDIELLDHVIVGRPECDPQAVGFFSFRQAGLL
jgi:DNA repair protein RadC